MLTRTVCILLELLVILAMTDDTWSQGVAPDRVVVSYPSKSITSFPSSKRRSGSASFAEKTST
jgi:hypothetical protein